ncbi:Gluconolactonase [Phycisphaerales bacterium]|nr:Gluconolactonase [Phycisphaerales bacterium]
MLPRPLAFTVAALTSLISTVALGGQDQSPALPDAVIDLRNPAGSSRVSARWQYTDAHVIPIEHHAPGSDLKPTGPAVETNDIHPRINTPDFDAAAWRDIAPGDLESRRTNGRLAFGWYRLDFTIPGKVGNLQAAGSSIILEVVVDDYAEVWVNGRLSPVLGQAGGPLVQGWNSPNRVTITRDAKPGEHVQVAIFASNGPLSEPPPNYVWIRSATLDFYKPGRAPFNNPVLVPTTIVRNSPALDSIIAPGTQAEMLADGFSFVEGPVWIPAAADNRYGGGGSGGYLLFSDPNRNVIHRYGAADNSVSIFRTKSGYSGIGGENIGEYHQPGSNGLALDPQGRLSICEHGNRRVTRLEPNGTITVLADRFESKRLNSPNDLVYRSDGALFFTDPPFGLPKAFEDARKELSFSGVFCLSNGVLRAVSKDLAAPNGLAFSPDEKHLYVDNWEVTRKVILRYDVAPDGQLSNATLFADMTSTTGEICLDGLKVDRSGNVLVSGPGGIWIYSAAGAHLGTVTLPELPANFAFGDADGGTLYMTARTGLYRMRMAGAGK